MNSNVITYDNFTVIHNVLSEEEIDEIHSIFKPIEIGHDSSISKWMVNSNKKTKVDAPNRNVTIIGIKSHELPFIELKIKECLHTLLEKEVTLEYPHYYTHYDVGGFHSLHVDAGIEEFDRQYVIIIHLSDPSDYEGGDLLVNKEVTPKEKGMAILFNGLKPHEVTKVTKGERIILSECVS